ncbi:MAG: hypothetical protein PHU25_05365 [Deltaproteobacteria bacterium]|nr:hypothetical protein [Deltaproteobacteria bacterium]
MKTHILMAILAAAAFSVLSCDEPSKPAYVEGSMSCGPQCAGSGKFIVKGGDMAEGGSKYWGSCSLSDNKFTFVVGTKEKGAATSATDFYVLVSGIAGPPGEGVFEGKVVINDKSRYTTFESAQVKNVNEWSFTPDDASDPNLCVVRLFATPAEGELTPSKATFDYFVWVRCDTLEGVLYHNTVELTYFEAQFYFAGCD